MSRLPTRVAVVEDDASVRTALQELLRSLGIDTHVFASAEACLVSEESGDAVDCVIADVNLPGMSGVALVQQLRTKRAGLPAVLMTGRDDRNTMALLDQAGDVPRLHKPFGETALLDALHQAMTAR